MDSQSYCLDAQMAMAFGNANLAADFYKEVLNWYIKKVIDAEGSDFLDSGYCVKIPDRFDGYLRALVEKVRQEMA